jgi:Fuc2NAc and GlcNAc transferase
MDWFNYLVIPAIVSYLGLILYRRIAIRRGIVANPNFRTLHEHPIPVGGGAVFSTVFVIGLVSLWWLNQLSDDLFWMLGIGGGAAILFGFLDDVKDIRAITKLALQFFLGSWALFWLNGGPLSYIDWLPVLVSIPVTVLFLVWIINAYNFMDGIDGMAISGAVFVSGVVILVMLLTNGESELTILFVLLLACTSAFMFFNWPPATIFMGDSGSIFLGYIFGVLILYTTMNNEISIWTWIIVFGYFIADTTVTQIARLILVKKWYIAHRSHAYQNLARISNSHLKVTLGVIFYYLMWLFPLAIWSTLEPDMAIFATIIALTPASIFSYKYGPALSST